jgi:hypothetical protein
VLRNFYAFLIFGSLEKLKTDAHDATFLDTFYLKKKPVILDNLSRLKHVAGFSH